MGGTQFSVICFQQMEKIIKQKGRVKKSAELNNPKA